MSDAIFPVLGLAGFAILMVVMIRWHFTRSRQLLEKWAAENGYRVVSASYRNFMKGPFFFSSEGQTVYRVTVIDGLGHRHDGWVRCGSWWRGLWADQVQVKWDQPA